MQSRVVRPFEAVAVTEVVPPWGGRLWNIIRTDITKEWFIIVSSQTFLYDCPQAVSKRTYLCRSVDILHHHLEDEAFLDRLLREASQDVPSPVLERWRFEQRRVEEEQYALELLQELETQPYPEDL